MEPLLWHCQPTRALRSPILVTAWNGWFDVGGAATFAVEEMRGPEATLLASIDAEEFFDFNECRPKLRFDANGKRFVEWPPNEVYYRELDNHERDLVFMGGVEPHLRWRAFVDAILEVIERLDVQLVVTMGATLSEVPHTRPPIVSGSTTNPNLGKRLNLNRPSYQGPTGIVGALHQRLSSTKIPAVSLRASAPAYVSGSPSPKVSRALLERFEQVTGLPTHWAKLNEETERWESEINDSMADNDDIVRYVRYLEARYDHDAKSSLPTPDEIAREVERFLRHQDGGTLN